jgi:mannitol-specific phosphotransferase system IIBC component
MFYSKINKITNLELDVEDLQMRAGTQRDDLFFYLIKVIVDYIKYIYIIKKKKKKKKKKILENWRAKKKKKKKKNKKRKKKKKKKK